MDLKHTHIYVSQEVEMKWMIQRNKDNTKTEGDKPFKFYISAPEFTKKKKKKTEYNEQAYEKKDFFLKKKEETNKCFFVYYHLL